METLTLHLGNAFLAQSNARQQFALPCITLDLLCHAEPQKVALCGLVNFTYALMLPYVGLRDTMATQDLVNLIPDLEFGGKVTPS